MKIISKIKISQSKFHEFSITVLWWCLYFGISVIVTKIGVYLLNCSIETAQGVVNVTYWFGGMSVFLLFKWKDSLDLKKSHKCELKTFEIWYSVYSYFNEDNIKTMQWLSGKNPLLNNLSPNDMIIAGRWDELLDFIKERVKAKNLEGIK